MEIEPLQTIESTLRSRPALRRAVVSAWHLLGVYVTYYLAFQLRFDGDVPLRWQVVLWNSMLPLAAAVLTVFALFRLHSGLWSYFSLDDLLKLGLAIFSAVALFALGVFVWQGGSFAGYPRSIFILEFLLLGLWTAGGRFLIRYAKEHHRRAAPPGASRDRVLLVGRLRDADLVVRGLRNRGEDHMVGVVSDEAGGEGASIHGLRVYRSEPGAVGRIARSTRANCLLILPPFNKPRPMNEIVTGCREANVACTFRTLPSVADLASGRLSASLIREVDIEDLLERGPVRLDRGELRAFLGGKSVLVTGAGGSIGAEICRQVAAYGPRCVVLFESSEFALYRVDYDLRQRHPELTVLPCAGDIRHPEEVAAAVHAAGGVDVVYHAAAYKHVPLMEANVPGCFRTNVLGTARLADAAEAAGVERFVMISSDKAVRPSSVMGATKRLAERLLVERPRTGTSFVAVRFGNVLESSGSVVPLFKRQIRDGGPVTVTSPDVRRFFMTVAEAVDLVLLAGAVGRDGEIMVLEMGEAVRIANLARNLIELSGFVPDQDIPITFTGLRPGEKEYEEVLTADENVVRTTHEKIWVMKGSGREGPTIDLARVEALVLAGDAEGLRRLAMSCVPEHTFAPAAEPAPGAAPA